MKQTVYKVTFLLFICTLLACPNGRVGGDWLIDSTAIQEGEGKNDIPAIDEPTFLPVGEIDFLADTSLVLGIQVGEEIKAYPLDILHWHEIVNDQINDIPVAITYSTLSASGIAFERLTPNNRVVIEFGVSGLLFNNNLIAFDRLSDCNWLQFERRAVNCVLPEQRLEDLILKEYPVIEMNWRTWRLLFPNSEVLTTTTGYNRPYHTYPYGDYQTNDTKLLFDLTVSLDALYAPIPFKEKGLGVIVDQAAKVYPMSVFSEPGFRLIEDEFRGVPLVIVGSQEKGLIVAYDRTRADGSIANFTITDPTMLILEDERGQEFNVLGKTIGLLSEENLRTVQSNMAYWFSWAVFYPNVELYED